MLRTGDAMIHEATKLVTRVCRKCSQSYQIPDFSLRMQCDECLKNTELTIPVLDWLTISEDLQDQIYKRSWE